jgi:hypothetical protein
MSTVLIILKNYYNFGFNNMRCFVKKKLFEKKLIRGSTISKNLLSGVRDLQKVKNRWFAQLLNLFMRLI